VVDDGGFHRTLDLARTKGAGAALAHVKQSPSPMNRVLAAVLTCSSSPRAEMEAMIENAGARELWDLQRRTRPLGVISNIAPLLGLLGTVTGIIRAFTQLAAKQTAIGNPAELASGIYEALITTAAGLIVAIPVYLLYHFLGDKADSLIRDIEEKALELVAVVFERRGPEAGSAPADLAEAHPPYGGRPQGGPEAGHEGA
jgi:biopolymer transport protein ExbB